MAASSWEAPDGAPPERSGFPDRERAERLVLELIGSQADSLLRVARRYSLCADDAYDAYQRGLEILMRHAERLDPDRAAGWLHTVVNHHIGIAWVRASRWATLPHSGGHARVSAGWHGER